MNHPDRPAPEAPARGPLGPPAGLLGPMPRMPGAARDVLLVLVVAALQLGGTVAAAHRQDAGAPGGPRSLDVLAYALLAAGPALLLARRRWPAHVLVAVLGVTLAYALLDYPDGPVFLALVVALLTALAAGRRRIAYVVLVVGYALFTWLVPWARDESFSYVAASAVAAWLLLLVAIGEVLRVRRAYAAAEARRIADEEAAREEAARRRAGEERLRIARELHDTLAHHISLMNVQASVGLELMDANPEQARTALTAVKHASREALGELRSVLAILRGDGEQAPRHPVLGLADLDELVARSSTPRLAVRLERVGAPRELPAPVGAAAYRITQEALTNVVRHAAGATSATVLLDHRDPDALTLTVDDNGTGPAPGATRAPAPGAVPAGGNGLRNMRERAAALGGTLSAGPRPDGGFRVSARLPLPAAGPGPGPDRP